MGRNGRKSLKNNIKMVTENMGKRLFKKGVIPNGQKRA